MLGAGVAIGIPLVAAALRGLGNESRPLEDRLKDLQAALAAVREAADLQASSIEQLTERYGRADEKVQKLVASIAQLAADEAAARVRELRDVFGEFTDDAGRGLRAAVNPGMLALGEALGVAAGRTREVQQAMQALEAANGPEAVFQALLDVLGALDRLQASTGAATDGMRDMRSEVNDLADAVGQAAAQVGRVSDATAAATAAAEGLAAAWGSVVATTARAAEMAAAAARAGRGGAAPGTFAIPPAGPRGSPSDFPLYPPPLGDDDFPLFGYGSTPAASGARGGGGGARAAAASAADAEMRARQAEIKRLIAEVAAEQAKLAAANEMVAASFAGAFADAIIGARSLQDALAGVAQQLGRMVLARGFEQMIGGLIGASGLSFGGFRAAGGPVMPGKSYMVGERGPEFFTPHLPGRIVPNGATVAAPVMVTVNNAPPGTEVRETTGTGGTRQIEIFIRDQVKGLISQGALDTDMRRNYGINRRPAGV